MKLKQQLCLFVHLQTFATPACIKKTPSSGDTMQSNYGARLKSDYQQLNFPFPISDLSSQMHLKTYASGAVDKTGSVQEEGREGGREEEGEERHLAAEGGRKRSRREKEEEKKKRNRRCAVWWMDRGVGGGAQRFQ